MERSAKEDFSSASYLIDVELVDCLWKKRRVVVQIDHDNNNVEGNLEPKTNTVNMVFFKKKFKREQTAMLGGQTHSSWAAIQRDPPEFPRCFSAWEDRKPGWIVAPGD